MHARPRHAPAGTYLREQLVSKHFSILRLELLKLDELEIIAFLDQNCLPCCQLRRIQLFQSSCRVDRFLKHV